MLRISKLADYGTVIMAYLAHHPAQPHNARQVAHRTHLTLPMVSKILKILTRENLLTSRRGLKGGYALARPAAEITMVNIIDAMDGGVALTECTHGKGLCHVEHFCTLQHNWQMITEAIRKTLAGVSLADILKPLPRP